VAAITPPTPRLVYVSPMNTTRILHSLSLSLSLAAAASTVARADAPQLGAQLAQLAAGMAPGQAPASQLFYGMSSEGVENPFMVQLDVGRCYTFIGTVGPTVQQLSIYLFDPTGKTVAKDTTDKSIAPKLTHCPRWPGMYKILGKIKRGAGELAIQAFAPGGAPVAAAAPPPAPAPAAPPTPPPAVHAPPPGYVAGPAPAQSPLAGQLLSLAATLAPGHAPATIVYGGFAPNGQEMPYLVQLEQARCYTFIGTVGPGVEQLSIYLVDPTGKTVAKDTTDKSISPRMRWCTQWPGMYKILAKIKRGAGELAVQGFLPR
jgi:hypothetical protein